MHLLQILLPLTDNQGHALDPALYGQVRKELVQHFGGFTAYTRSPAEGVWVSDEQDAVSDEIIVFEVMVPRFDLPWWREYRKRLERSFRQEHVVIRAQAVIAV
jgi:hypothetical protein